MLKDQDSYLPRISRAVDENKKKSQIQGDSNHDDDEGQIHRYNAKGDEKQKIVRTNQTSDVG